MRRHSHLFQIHLVRETPKPNWLWAGVQPRGEEQEWLPQNGQRHREAFRDTTSLRPTKGEAPRPHGNSGSPHPSDPIPAPTRLGLLECQSLHDRETRQNQPMTTHIVVRRVQRKMPPTV